ncbi:MAG: hypothetical protein A2X56_08250 [Nitrospirae bacterium GWC2_57_13]|nr:MAG: hypothetical protein A2072_08375 [Nitrospirae bacterium GWC1_57_7]OGW27681.1 MAG: hypothetical protein A2X56_08250 [Nitrospirae bacterium GWC2_57_13]OGW45232.1 MAG: hypothetical protein A2X57_00835 [Nitrospirae bacterium GWD2_57_8]HAR46006.1 hypothetical protein [Nitrospiraceae bacterium]HAS52989.1 hypothetical protein [Nitrospiraceae bacterium]
MKPASAKALVWTAAVLIVLGMMILSPSGAFALFSLAALCAAIPAAFGSKRPRIIAAVLLVLSLALGASYYAAFKKESKAYSQRAKERAAKPPAPLQQNQGPKK